MQNDANSTSRQDVYSRQGELWLTGGFSKGKN
jgi:hypothetical protein